MIRHPLKPGDDIRKQHPGLSGALILLKPLHMPVLKLPLLHIYLLLKLLHKSDLLIHIPIAGKTVHGILHGLIHKPQKLTHLALGILGKVYPLLLSLPCGIRHILRMISDALYIIGHMEKRADLTSVIHRQVHLPDLNEIINNGTV